mgnify:CR=1 FL=1
MCAYDVDYVRMASVMFVGSYVMFERCKKMFERLNLMLEGRETCSKGRETCSKGWDFCPSSIGRAFFGFEGRLVACFSYGSPRFCVCVYVCLSLYPRLPSFWGCVCACVCVCVCVCISLLKKLAFSRS